VDWVCDEEENCQLMEFHYFDGECPEPTDEDCESCNGHQNGCHEESIPDPNCIPSGGGGGGGCGCTGEQCPALLASAVGAAAGLKVAAKADDLPMALRVLAGKNVTFSLDSATRAVQLLGCNASLVAKVAVSAPLFRALSGAVVGNQID
jgi:hypothetical protein